MFVQQVVFFLVFLAFYSPAAITTATSNPLSQIVIEGDHYVEQFNCSGQPLLNAWVDGCTSHIDCAIECSLGKRTEPRCVGFTFLTKTLKCELDSELNCGVMNTNKSNQTAIIYYRRISAAKQTTTSAPINKDKVLTPRKRGDGQPVLDGLNPTFCGDGSLRHLYDPNSLKEKIVSGSEAEEGEFPYQALIVIDYYNKKKGYPINLFCGGTLIDREWVLAAAHCFEGDVYDSHDKMIDVSLGCLLMRDKGAETIQISRGNNNTNIFIHPDYPNKPQDFALLRLTKPVKKFTKLLSPICLPKRPVGDFTNKIVMTTGWGETVRQFLRRRTKRAADNGRFPDVLQKLPRRLVPGDECDEELKKYNGQPYEASMMLCSSKSGNRDQCHGDSGGPWAVVDQPFGTQNGSRWTLVGLTSWGHGCGKSVGVGAKITDDILDWILKTVTNT